MALPPPSVARQPLHQRGIRIEAFQRDDGLFDLDARLTDTTSHPVELLHDRRAPGDPIHDMHLRITVDRRFTVIDVHAHSAAVPVPGSCETITPAYRRLVGLNLLRSFRAEVRARMGRTTACTHLSELAALLPTAALQSLSHVIRGQMVADPSEPPFFIGQCHAYARNGEVVRRHYPQWFVQAD
jgi:hypothetical protein